MYSSIYIYIYIYIYIFRHTAFAHEIVAAGIPLSNPTDCLLQLRGRRINMFDSL